MKTIGLDYDLDRTKISADTDPMDAYFLYLQQVKRGTVEDMGFLLGDFIKYIDDMRQPAVEVTLSGIDNPKVRGCL